MIHKNANYGAIENVTLVQFGKGTISIVSGTTENHESILMKTCPKRTIGSRGVKVEDSNIYKPEVAIAFHSEESFNVFFEIVLEVKASFESKKQKK